MFERLAIIIPQQLCFFVLESSSYCSRRIVSTNFYKFYAYLQGITLTIGIGLTKYGFNYLLTSRIQNDPLEYHFGLYRQMSGSQYHISYCQILESKHRLQISNILKLFQIKTQSDLLRPCKLNNLFLIPVRANFLPPSGYILCFVIEYLILVNNPRGINIVVIVF